VKGLSRSDFCGLKKLDESALSVFENFMKFSWLSLPVYFHSVFSLMGLGNFYYVIIRDCLVVFRYKKMYSNTSLILYFAPVHRSNDKNMEREVLGALLYAGFSARITQSELDWLGVSLSKTRAGNQPTYSEFIYSADKSVQMKGKKYLKIRNLVNKFNSSGGVVTRGLELWVPGFIDSWAKAKKIRYHQYIDFLVSFPERFLFTCLMLDGVPMGFTAVELVGQFYCQIVSIVNYEAPFHVGPALHFHTMKALPEGSLVTSGAGVWRGLIDQKRELRPVVEEKVYRIPSLGLVQNAYELVKDFLK